MAGRLGACGALLAMFCGTAMALPSTPSKGAIRGALTGWMADFNAGRADRVCDLFAQELRYDYREFPERGYREICDLLHRSLADPTRRFSYALDIKEILVSGDLAVVRLVWTLTVTPRDASAPTISQEPGMDVFRRQRDGSWKIVRFIAYEAR
ncbi:MAG: YybH family protein [Hyphomicrobiales bacterium]